MRITYCINLYVRQYVCPPTLLTMFLSLHLITHRRVCLSAVFMSAFRCFLAILNSRSYLVLDPC